MSISAVFVVSTGEHGEGRWPEAARASLAAAKRYCERKYGVIPVHRGKGAWMCNKLGTHVDEVWIDRLPLSDRRPR